MRSKSTGTATEVTDIHPRRCPNGHDWRPPRSMRPGWDGSARTWHCAACPAVVVDRTADEWVRPSSISALSPNPALAGLRVPATCPRHGPRWLYLDEQQHVTCDHCDWIESAPSPSPDGTGTGSGPGLQA